MTAVSHDVPVRTPHVPHARDVLALLKPVTWFPPMWAFLCGVVSSGLPATGRWRLVLTGVALTGPLVCAASQAVNDWFDRHVDAINEPQRPIPSGRIPGRWGLGIAIAWSLLGLAVAATLGRWGLVATAGALVLAWAYSMPPVRLKQNGWFGNAAVGVAYEGLAWVTGAAVMAGGALPGPRVLLLALLYSVAAHGILTLNDFKAIAGDARMGVRSLPVQFGPRGAALAASVVMLVPQLVVVGLLFAWGAPVAASVICALVAIQAAMMAEFTSRPVERALWMSALGVPFEVLGMMVAALALRGVL